MEGLLWVTCQISLQPEAPYLSFCTWEYSRLENSSGLSFFFFFKVQFLRDIFPDYLSLASVVNNFLLFLSLRAFTTNGIFMFNYLMIHLLYGSFLSEKLHKSGVVG